MSTANRSFIPILLGGDYELQEPMRSADKSGEATIGGRLLALRMAAGLTQAEVARRTRIPQSVVSDMENNRYKNPSAAQIVELADLFMTTPRYILTGEGAKLRATELTEEERSLLHAYRLLDPSFKQVLRANADTLLNTDITPETKKTTARSK
jgi:transcriptional regulator with XRE-family HTH domain